MYCYFQKILKDPALTQVRHMMCKFSAKIELLVQVLGMTVRTAGHICPVLPRKLHRTGVELSDTNMHSIALHVSRVQERKTASAGCDDKQYVH